MLSFTWGTGVLVPYCHLLLLTLLSFSLQARDWINERLAVELGVYVCMFSFCFFEPVPSLYIHFQLSTSPQTIVRSYKHGVCCYSFSEREKVRRSKKNNIRHQNIVSKWRWRCSNSPFLFRLLLLQLRQKSKESEKIIERQHTHRHTGCPQKTSFHLSFANKTII